MLSKFLKKHTDFGLLLLRLITGASFIFIHGLPKITGGPELWARLGTAMSNYGITFFPVFWGFMAAISEFGGGILLILGLFTRTASGFMAFTMFTAILNHFLRLDPWNRVFYPIEMLGIFLCLIFIGAGKYSVDRILKKRSRIS